MHTIEEFREMVKQELAKKEYVGTPYSLWEPIVYMLEDGGKRLRPVLTLMTYNLYRDDIEKALKAAVGIEIFHNYTLLHDDVMDDATLRRGRLTVHKKWNSNVAILSGDAAAITAYRQIESCEDKYLRRAIDGFNQVAMDVCRGQQFDMEFETRNDVTEEEYLEMIMLKTSALISGSLRHGALIAGASEEDCAAWYEFGGFLGVAFQLQDDFLDVYGDSAEFGKNIGGDILINKKTYMLIKALELAQGEMKEELHGWISKKEPNPEEKIKAVTEIYNKLEIDRVAQEKISEYMYKSIEVLDRINIPEEHKASYLEVIHELVGRKK